MKAYGVTRAGWEFDDEYVKASRARAHRMGTTVEESLTGTDPHGEAQCMCLECELCKCELCRDEV